MTLLNGTRYSWRAARQFTLIMTLALSTIAARAQTSPYTMFQYSTLTGSGNTITANWVPVVTANGTIYENVTLLFDVDSSGNLTIAPGYPQMVMAQLPRVTSFQAGTYVGPSSIYGGQMIIIVSGPGIAPGGATEFALAAAAGANSNTFPSSGTWYVGTIANNPLAARLKAAGITSTAMAYGVGGSGCYCSADNYAWNQNVLMGASQVGNALTFYSFTDSNGKDYNEPLDQITYTLQAQP